MRKIIGILVIGIFICLTISSVLGLEMQTTKTVDKTILNNQNGPSVSITEPREGYLYWAGIEMGPVTTDTDAAHVYYDTLFYISTTEDVVIEKTKWYRDDAELNPDDDFLIDGKHVYKIEVFDEYDNSASDEVTVLGILCDSKSRQIRTRCFARSPLVNLLSNLFR